MAKRRPEPGERFKFTDQWLVGVPAAVLREKADGSGLRAEARDEYKDEDVSHLRLAVTEAGKKRFILYRRFDKPKPERKILGTYPALSLADAREKARAWNTLADLGKDPEAEERRIADEATAERQRIARANSAQVTFAQVAEDFIAEALTGKRRVRDEQEIRRHIIPGLGDKPINKITAAHIQLFGKPFKKQAATGRLLLSHIKRIFSFALHEFVEDDDGEPVNRYGLDADPSAGVRPRKLFGVKVPRDRVLTDDEIKEVWPVLDGLGNDPTALALKLIFFTGLRVEDVSTLQWSGVDLKERTITILRDDYKAGAKFIVPLVDGAVTLLRSIKRGKKGNFVFSARGADGAKPINGWGPFFTSKVRPNIAKPDPKLGDWTRHDVRRTVLTTFARLQVQKEIRELAIGHLKSGNDAVYNQWEFYPERREAFDKWAAFLADLTTPAKPAKVVRLKQVAS